jgi:leader peptidase (prepilin peptidase)/N-methyltransferase
MHVALAALTLAPAFALGSALRRVVAAWVPEGPPSWAKAPFKRLPAVELVTALLVAACFASFGLTARAFIAAFFLCVLVVLSAIDAERRILPNRIVLPAAAIVLGAQIAFFPERTLTWVLAAVLASLFLFAALLVYPPGMGMGDVKLALLLGAALGESVAVALLAAVLAVSVPAVFLILRDGAAARGSALPFGPYLALGAVVALFFGEPLLDAYVELL